MDLTQLIERLQRVKFDRNADLPYPNLYWATVRKVGVPEIHTYIAGGHTNQALQKVCNWCVEHHNFRPNRSDTKVLLRRFLLGDLVDNPAAYFTALATAQANHERDIVEGLKALPAKVWKDLRKVPVGEVGLSDDLWAQLGAELSAFEQRHLPLR